MLNSLSAEGIGCFWGKADIEWQAMPVDPVEIDPTRTFLTHRVRRLSAALCE
jgi:hypothetical protein